MSNPYYTSISRFRVKMGADEKPETHRNNSMELRLLNVNEVCELLQIGRTTLYRLVNEGQIRKVSIGAQRTLFRPVDIADFINAAVEG